MAIKATIMDMPDLWLAVSKATEFPADIKGAWNRLESKLASLKGRKFYGLTFFEKGELTYYAGVEPRDDKEIPALGYPTMFVKGGKYARVKLMDWPTRTDEIKEIFQELREAYEKDPAGPEIEFYRSQSELHLLIPLRG